MDLFQLHKMSKMCYKSSQIKRSKIQINTALFIQICLPCFSKNKTKNSATKLSLTDFPRDVQGGGGI